MSRILTILVLLAAAALGGYLVFRPAAPPAEVPTIATDHLHPLIVAAIDEAVANVKAAPRSAQNWGELGMVLLAHDIPVAARQCLQQAATLQPDESAWPYLIGYSWESTDYAKSLGFYQQALQLQPNYLPLRVRMARIFMRQGQFDQSAAVLEEAYRLAPHDPYVLMTKGQLAILQGDSDAAMEFYRQATEQPDWSPQPAWQELTALAMQRGEFERAYEYRRQLDSLPVIARMEQPDLILERLRKYDGLEKDLAQQGDFALARGDLSTAIRSYEQFIQSRSDMPTVYYNLASAYTMAGRFDDAPRVYEAVLERFGSTVPAHMGLAQLHELREDYEAAIEEYERVLKIKPDHQQAWLFLGLQHERTGEPDRAETCYTRAVAIDPSSSQAQLALGILQFQQNRPAQARPHLQRAATLDPTDPIAKDFLQQVEQQLESAP